MYLIGIDEAGRGALAGPVCVGAVLYPEQFDWREAYALITKRGAPKLRDSKKMSRQQRDILYAYIIEHAALKYTFAMVDARTIDAIGIVNAANDAVAKSILGLEIRHERARVVLDAGLRAPMSWPQQSFVRGDETIPAISFASIVAKVSRDRHMEALGETYAPYGFAQHKGYGTSAHYMALNSHGISDLHRKTFLGKLEGLQTSRK